MTVQGPVKKQQPDGLSRRGPPPEVVLSCLTEPGRVGGAGIQGPGAAASPPQPPQCAPYEVQCPNSNHD